MNLADLYEDVLSTMDAANTPETERSFLSALKMVVNDLNGRLKTSIVAPTYVTTVEIGFEDYCDNVFHSGVKFFMQRMGGWAQDPDTESYNFYQAELRKVIGRAIDASEDFTTRNEA